MPHRLAPRTQATLDILNPPRNKPDRPSLEDADAPTAGGATAAVDWPALFFDPAADLPGKCLARARRRYGDSPDAEAAYNHALECVSADDWRQLRDHYAGKGSPAGFLAITFFNYLEEYARRKYPRVRPPAWIKRVGDSWVRAWQLLCLQRQLPETVVDALGQNNRERRAEMRHAVIEIKQRVKNCGRSIAEQTTADEDALGAGGAERPGEQPDAAAQQALELTLLHVVSGLLHETGAARHVDSEQRQRLAAIGNRVDLDDRERLLLRLIYEEGHKIAAAARALNMQRKQASRLHAAVLKRLRAELVPLGLQGQ